MRFLDTEVLLQGRIAKARFCVLMIPRRYRRTALKESTKKESLLKSKSLHLDYSSIEASHGSYYKQQDSSMRLKGLGKMEMFI